MAIRQLLLSVLFRMHQLFSKYSKRSGMGSHILSQSGLTRNSLQYTSIVYNCIRLALRPKGQQAIRREQRPLQVYTAIGTEFSVHILVLENNTIINNCVESCTVRVNLTLNDKLIMICLHSPTCSPKVSTPGGVSSMPAYYEWPRKTGSGETLSGQQPETGR